MLFGKAGPDRKFAEFGGGVHMEPPHDSCAMKFDSLGRDIENRRDLVISAAVRDQLQNFALPITNRRAESPKLRPRT